jgi:hypothetical protein
MLDSRSGIVSVAVRAAQTILVLYRKVTTQYHTGYGEVFDERLHQLRFVFREGALALEFHCFGFIFHVPILLLLNPPDILAQTALHGNRARRRRHYTGLKTRPMWYRRYVACGTVGFASSKRNSLRARGYIRTENE